MKNKIIVGIMLIILILGMFQSPILADGTAGGSSFDFSSKMRDMVDKDGDSNVITPVKQIAGTAITVTQVIAMGVAIIMLIVLAMKYMTSAPGDKATIKKHAIVYIVGAVIMFAATGILEIIRKFAGVISVNSNAAE